MKKIIVSALLLMGAPALAAATTLYQVLENKGSYYTRDYVQISGESAAINAKVNQTIVANADLKDKPCPGNDPRNDYSLSIGNVMYQRGSVLSYVTSEEVSCAQAAHPSSDTIGQTFDLKTGAEVSDLSTQLGPNGIQVLNAALIKEGLVEHPATPDDTCAADVYGDNDVSVESFYLQGANLVIWNFSSHATQACDVQVTIPLTQLSHHIVRGSLFDRVLNGVL